MNTRTYVTFQTILVRNSMSYLQLQSLNLK